MGNVIVIASDHGGYTLKEEVKKYLISEGYQVIDCGCDSLNSCHYPIYAKRCAMEVLNLNARGIVICTTGEGVMMTVNKFKGIRCGLVYNEDVASLIVRHNNANMMAMGAKYLNVEQAKKYVDIFLNSEFEGGRHFIRTKMIDN